MRNKRGQALSGGSIGGAVVLLMILIFSLVYIVLVPEEYREELNLTPAPEYNVTVLYEKPGRLFLDEEEDLETKIHSYSIEGVRLDNTLNTESDLLMHQGSVKKSLISADILTFDFSVEDTKNLEKLYFNANVIDKENSGIISIKFNGNTIFSREVSKNDNLQVALPLHEVEEENTLKVSVSSPGFAFWASNYYLLSDIYLIRKEYSKTNSEIKRVVFVDGDVLARADTAKFLGYANQLSPDSAELDISFNGNQIYSGIPFTSSGMELDIPKSYVKSNNNDFRFKIGRDGKYDLIYMYLHLKTTEGEESENIERYSFTLSDRQWNKVEDSRYECELYIDKSGGKDNSVNIDVNGDNLRYGFDYNNTIRKDICDYLVEDRNILTIVPDEEIDLAEIKLSIHS